MRRCIKKNLISGRVVGADSTHMRANASCASEELVKVSEAPDAYLEQLDEYEEDGMEEIARQAGKRRKKRTKQIKRDIHRPHKRVSRTDPTAGHLNRPSKLRDSHYPAHQAGGDETHGIIFGQL